MKQHRGIWFPDSEEHLCEMIDFGPQFAGLPTYQFKKFAKAFPLIKNFRHAVDVGSNVGLWARVLVRCFGRVSAFEPVPELNECLWRNIDANDLTRVELFPVALGETDGRVSLQTRGNSTGYTHVSPDGKGVIADVPMRRLDSFGLEKVDFLKIDTEGFELYVTRGGKQTIMASRPVMIIEQKPTNPERYGLTPDDLVSTLRDWGAVVAFEWSGDYCFTWPK